MIGWLDVSAGVSGDMLLGALVDAGVEVASLREALAPLGLGIDLELSEVQRGGLRAAKVAVVCPVEDAPAHRTLPEVEALLAALAPAVRDPATAVFRRLAEAEAAVHGVGVEEVHFHEVGALDAIADVVGVVAGFASLGLDALHAGAIGVGAGRAGAAHGSLPVPVPAVLALTDGLPITAGPAAFESATPTGAALLAHLVTDWTGLPAMTTERVGLGAGGTDPDAHPNVVRLALGEPTGPSVDASTDIHMQVEANVDDMDPRLWPVVIDALLAAGADDAWLTPIHMKKGRPALTLSALTAAATLDAVQRAIFRETTTIGVRVTTVSKRALDRTIEHVEVDGHRIAVKVATLDGVAVNRSVEWDDVLAAAIGLDRPAKVVLAQAVAAATETVARP